MGRKKIREEKSKVYGTKQVLSELNSAAHANEHARATPGNPGGTNYVAASKWGWGE